MSIVPPLETTESLKTLSYSYSYSQLLKNYSNSLTSSDNLAPAASSLASFSDSSG